MNTPTSTMTTAPGTHTPTQDWAAKLHSWHQSVGIYVCLAIIAWGLSGLAHPLITRLNPQPAAFFPPSSTVDPDAIANPVTTLSAAGITDFRALRLLNFESRPYFRVETDDRVIWIDAISSRVRPHGEKDYAVHLARHYLGDYESVVSGVDKITAFDSDYLYIDRLLPVYRVTFDRPDEMRAHVETATGRLATLTDDRKALTGRLFRLFHSWSGGSERHWSFLLMAALLIGAAFTSAAGLFVYAALWRRGQLSPHRSAAVRWHRGLGAVIALLALSFALSGLLHLTVKHLDGNDLPTPLRNSFHVSELSAPWPALSAALRENKVYTASLVRVLGKAHWLVPLVPADRQPGHHHGPPTATKTFAARYLDAGSGRERSNGATVHALELARAYARVSFNSAATLEHITAFGGEYGFIFKRLPVYAVRFSEQPGHTWYVEPLTGALAAHVGPLARLEGWVFSFFHKWHFVDALGRNTRDLLMVMATVLLVFSTTLGAWHYLRRRLA